MEIDEEEDEEEEMAPGTAVSLFPLDANCVIQSFPIYLANCVISSF